MIRKLQGLHRSKLYDKIARTVKIDSVAATPTLAAPITAAVFAGTILLHAVLRIMESGKSKSNEKDRVSNQAVEKTTILEDDLLNISEQFKH